MYRTNHPCNSGPFGHCTTLEHAALPVNGLALTRTGFVRLAARGARAVAVSRAN